MSEKSSAPGAPEAEPRKPALSPRENFDLAVATTVELVDCGALLWTLAGNGAISSRLDGEAVAQKLGQQDNPERKVYEKILSTEIVQGLNFAANVVPPLAVPGPRELTPEDHAERLKRFAEVERKLFSDSLRQRVTIRRTSKGQVLEGLRWDVSVKKHDLQEGSVADIAYGTIELALTIAPSTAQNPLSEIFGSPRTIVSFDCHVDDLAALIRDLSDLKANLEKLTPRP